MGATSLAPAMTPPMSPASAAPVLVAVDRPADQRRGTVAVRLLLAAPHLVVLAGLGLVAVAVAVVGWWGALARGRLPRFAAGYLTGFVRWQTRVAAYLFLLTDAYPPFSTADAAYPVRITMAPAAGVRRRSVAARPVLAVPALMVAGTVTVAVGTLVAVASWLVALTRGRLMPSLQLTAAAFVRYQARLAAYVTLLTPVYPWGLFGDPVPAAVPAAAPTVAGGVVGPRQPSPPSPADDPYWRIVLTPAAKNLIVVFLVLGVAAVMAFNVTSVVSHYGRLHTDEAATVRVERAYRSLSAAVNGYETQVRLCGAVSDRLPCLTGAAQAMAGAFTDFHRSLSATAMAGTAVTARSRLVHDTQRAESDFRSLSTADSAGHYELSMEAADLPQLLGRFDVDFEQLGIDLVDVG